MPGPYPPDPNKPEPEYNVNEAERRIFDMSAWNLSRHEVEEFQEAVEKLIKHLRDGKPKPSIWTQKP